MLGDVASYWGFVLLRLPDNNIFYRIYKISKKNNNKQSGILYSAEFIVSMLIWFSLPGGLLMYDF